MEVNAEIRRVFYRCHGFLTQERTGQHATLWGYRTVLQGPMLEQQEETAISFVVCDYQNELDERVGIALDASPKLGVWFARQQALDDWLRELDDAQTV